MARKTPEILLSNMAFGKSKYALKPLEWLGDFARGAGFDGIQFTPTFDLFPGRHPEDVAQAHNKGKIVIRAFEAAYRETRRSAETHRSPLDTRPRKFSVIGSAIRSPLGRLAMPETINSVRVIRSVEDQIRTRDQFDRPVTLYPQRTSREDEPQTMYVRGDKLCQPRDQLAHLVNARSVKSLNDKLCDERGFKYKYDFFHGRCRSGQDKPGIISNHERSIPELAPNIVALDLSVGRTDIPGESHIDTMGELGNVIEGKYEGELGEMWQTVRLLVQPEFITVETLCGSVAASTCIQTEKDMQKVFGDIVEGVRANW